MTAIFARKRLKNELPPYATAAYALPCLACRRPECDYGPGCPWAGDPDRIYPIPDDQVAGYRDAQRVYAWIYKRIYRLRHDAEAIRQSLATAGGPDSGPPPDEGGQP
jgi:hypothetical protein